MNLLKKYEKKHKRIAYGAIFLRLRAFFPVFWGGDCLNGLLGDNCRGDHARARVEHEHLARGGGELRFVEPDADRAGGSVE